MRMMFIIALLGATLAGCGKLGLSGSFNQAVGNWARVSLPDGCNVKQIAAEHDNGVAILCEDGRVFH